MQQLQFLTQISKRQWMLLLCVMLIAYLARFALAQDTVVPEETATPPAASTVIEPVEPTQVIEPVQMVDAPVTPEPTQPMDVIVSPELLMLATIIPDVETSATPVAPIETTAIPETLLPTVSIPKPESTLVMVEPPLVEAATVTPVVLVEMQPTTLPTEVMLMADVTEEAGLTAATAEPAMTGSQLSGSIHASLLGVNATVTIAGLDTQQTVAVQSDGSFALDVLPGDYQVIITAQSHLPYILEVSMSDQAVVLPTITLLNNQMGGEIVRLIIQNFGMPTAPGLSAADVNGDGLINIYDLAIAGSSFR